MNLLMILDMAAEALGDRQALCHRGDGPTYAELRQQAASGGAYLRAHGEAAIFVGQSGTNFVSAFFASNWSDVPFVPLNFRLPTEQLHQLIDRVGDAVIICEPDYASALDRPGRKLVTTSEWASIVATPPAPGETPIEAPENFAVKLFTSGTTAEPKAAVLEHRHLAAYILGSVEFAAADEDDVALVSVPPYHIAGVANLLSNVFAGRRIIYLPTFEPSKWLEIVRSEGVTQAMVVPTMLARITEVLGGAKSADVPTLRTISYGGARMPHTVLERALQLFPETGFVNAYGLTETSSSIAVLGPEDHRKAIESGDELTRQRLSSVGRPLPGIEIEIREDGRVVSPNAHGEIWVRGEQVSGSYAGMESPCDEQGWFPTRDVGWIDEEGYLFVEGRADDTIIRGGENIAPAEIEEVLLRHPAVLDVAVVGIPDEEWGQRIAAAVVLRPGHNPAPGELSEWSRAQLRSSKAVERVIIRDELPRTETGKLLRRHVLADLLASPELGEPQRTTGPSA
jgi:acyl-CoA synthetase (AMP-forming)/AMP-acid ligase II